MKISLTYVFILSFILATTGCSHLTQPKTSESNRFYYRDWVETFKSIEGDVQSINPSSYGVDGDIVTFWHMSVLKKPEDISQGIKMKILVQEMAINCKTNESKGPFFAVAYSSGATSSVSKPLTPVQPIVPIPYTFLHADSMFMCEYIKAKSREEQDRIIAEWKEFYSQNPEKPVSYARFK